MPKTRVTRYSCALVKEGTHLYEVPKTLDSAFKAYLFLNEVCQLGMQSEEYFIEIFLDTKAHAIGYAEVSHGTLNNALVHPREVFKLALLSNAYSIIVAHNHPSGDLCPSQDDINTTRRLKSAGEILNIHLVDHLIINNCDYYSFKGNATWF